jgi:hypothetical protein
VAFLIADEDEGSFFDVFQPTRVPLPSRQHLLTRLFSLRTVERRSVMERRDEKKAWEGRVGGVETVFWARFCGEAVVAEGRRYCLDAGRRRRC